MIDKAKEGITEGAHVLYVLSNGKSRPAVIVEAWKASPDKRGEVNLCVFTDFSNDKAGLVEWATSVPYSKTGAPGTWHWPDGHECEEVEESSNEGKSDAQAKADEAEAERHRAADKAAAERAEKIGTACEIDGGGEGVWAPSPDDLDGPLVCTPKGAEGQEPKAGDPCVLDGADGVLEDQDGTLVCVPKKDGGGV